MSWGRGGGGWCLGASKEASMAGVEWAWGSVGGGSKELWVWEQGDSGRVRAGEDLQKHA